ncbi:MAG: CinA family nicotinamide mononucleotide deamidase-related protein [Myxococcota bacterium]|nr:CinA family nicotinamide mononucleotide deamidase-related protein [Myxococcota bacterium]
MTVALLSTGEEVLTGETVDTNSAWLAAALWDAGVSVRTMVTVGDSVDHILDALRLAAERASVIIMTGGLGPTEDDLTAEACAKWAGVERYECAEALGQIEERYRARGRPLSPANRKQAVVPIGSRLLENHWGTAPGFSLTAGGTTVHCLPGVPMEMRHMFAEWIRPQLVSEAPPVLVRMRTFGVAESRLQAMIGPLDLGDAVLGFRAHIPEVQIKLRFPHASGPAERTAVVNRVAAVLGPALYCIDGGDLAETVVEALAAHGQTVSLAESCTAGMISSWLANVPGASAVLMNGMVTYSNASKVNLLGVDEALIAEHGAVSEPVARAMAEQVRAVSNTDWGLGITGVAGPGGGSTEKPVGTVHLAVAGPMGTVHRHAVVPGDRTQVRQRSAGALLHMLCGAVAAASSDRMRAEVD